MIVSEQKYQNLKIFVKVDTHREQFNDHPTSYYLFNQD